MNRFLLMSLASLALGAPAFADDAKAPPAPAAKAAPEAEKPAAADAKVKVDEKKNAQQSKMAACNADPKAKTLKGAARKDFMKECLKSGPAADAAPAPAPAVAPAPAAAPK
jgi:hypothetical protein